MPDARNYQSERYKEKIKQSLKEAGGRKGWRSSSKMSSERDRDSSIESAEREVRIQASLAKSSSTHYIQTQRRDNVSPLRGTQTTD